jgi:hypothetical protein
MDESTGEVVKKEFEDGEERTYRDGELVETREAVDTTGIILFLTE